MHKSGKSNRVCWSSAKPLGSDGFPVKGFDVAPLVAVSDSHERSPLDIVISPDERLKDYQKTHQVNFVLCDPEGRSRILDSSDSILD